MPVLAATVKTGFLPPWKSQTQVATGHSPPGRSKKGDYGLPARSCLMSRSVRKARTPNHFPNKRAKWGMPESSPLFPVWKGRQSAVFHQLSVRSQVGLSSTARGWRGEGASTQACFIDRRKLGESPPTRGWIIYEPGERKRRSVERWLWIQEAALADKLVWLHLPGAQVGVPASQGACAPPLHAVFYVGEKRGRLMVLVTPFYHILVQRE